MSKRPKLNFKQRLKQRWPQILIAETLLVLGFFAPQRPIDLWIVATTNTQAIYDQLEATYNLDIDTCRRTRCDDDSDWCDPEMPEVASSEVGSLRMQASAPAIAQALRRYPVDTLYDYLTKICVTKNLSNHGLEAGGTFGPFTVFIDARRLYLRRNSQIMQATLHHEIDSLLRILVSGERGTFGTEKTQWESLNPPSFAYTQSVDEFEQKYTAGDYSKSVSTEFYTKGFLDLYGTSSVSNDMSTYAEVIFTDPDKMRELVATYPAIRAKYLLVKQFYLSVSPDFAPTFDAIL